MSAVYVTVVAISCPTFLVNRLVLLLLSMCWGFAFLTQTRHRLIQDRKFGIGGNCVVVVGLHNQELDQGSGSRLSAWSAAKDYDWLGVLSVAICSAALLWEDLLHPPPPVFLPQLLCWKIRNPIKEAFSSDFEWIPGFSRSCRELAQSITRMLVIRAFCQLPAPASPRDNLLVCQNA